MATFYNQATLSYNGNTTNSNITTGELIEVLSATKTAVSDRYNGNDTVTFVISIVNAGTTPYTGVTVTDNLGAYTFGTGSLVPLTYVPGTMYYYVNGVLQTTLPTITATSSLVISGITVPASGNVTLVFETRVNQYAPLGVEDSIVNQATITAQGLSAPILVTAAIYPNTEPYLTISKSVSPSSVTENGQLTYTFVIQNAGNTQADVADNVVVTDTFNPILDNISVTFNGTAWTEPANYTYDESTGAFATVAGQITVPAASYTQDAQTGVWTVDPGVSVLTVTGTV